MLTPTKKQIEFGPGAAFPSLDWLVLSPAASQCRDSLVGKWTAQRFLNLAEMNSYQVWQLGLAIAWLKEFELMSGSVLAGMSRDKPIPPDISDDLRRRMEHTARQCSLLELDAALARIERVTVSLNGGRTTWDELHHEIRILRESIESQLRFRRFAFIPVGRGALLDRVEADWETVVKNFPVARDDIREAVECYALDCNTASVFHSMRVAEHGLRGLAWKLRLRRVGSQKHPLEFAEWGSILNGLKGKLGAIQQSPGRSAKKAAEAQFYADAASHADYLNELWRKEVSHARGPFNAPEALNALMRTKAFMELLSSRIKQRP